MRLRLGHPGDVPPLRRIVTTSAAAFATAVLGFWCLVQAVERGIEAMAGDED